MKLPKKVKNSPKNKGIKFNLNKKQELYVLIILLFFVILLWAGNLNKPIKYDAVIYSSLSSSIIEGKGYTLDGEFYNKYPPGTSFFEIPFVILFGNNMGPKIMTLIATLGFIIFSFLFFREYLGKYSLLLAFMLAFNYRTIYLSSTGLSDGLFGMFFILTLYFYKKYCETGKYFLLVALFTTCCVMIRVVGITTVGLIGLHMLITYRNKIRNILTWKNTIIITVPIIALSVYFASSFILSGNISAYFQENEKYIQDFSSTIITNIKFYINPIHNVLPLLFLFMIIGLAVYSFRKEYLLISLAIPIYLFPLIFWWYAGVRFVFPLLPILFFFAIKGLLYTKEKIKKEAAEKKIKKYTLIANSVFAAGIILNLALIPLLSYGETNYIIESKINIPPVFHKQEVQVEIDYEFVQNVKFINRQIPENSQILMDPNYILVYKDVFRDDITLVNNCSIENCFDISNEMCDENELFKSKGNIGICTYKVENAKTNSNLT